MQLARLKSLLSAGPARPVTLQLPDGRTVPAHYHITEVGHVTRRFIDCGGTIRSSESCLLQVWTASDRDDGHRLDTRKLAEILQRAGSVLPNRDLPVEIEFEDGPVAQYPVQAARAGEDELILELASRHTDCLARDRCGTPEEQEATVGASACCGDNCCTP